MLRPRIFVARGSRRIQMAENVNYKWKWMRRPWLRRPALLVLLPIAFVIHAWLAFWYEAWPSFKNEVKTVW